MHNIKEELEQLLLKDNRLTADGKLMKNKVVELAHKLDKDLFKLLMSSDNIKKHFFADIDGTLVFDKVKFQDFINLKEFLADSYTRYKSKIGLQVNGDHLAKSKDVVLVWPFKDCVLEGGQTKDERESRKEIFWNETLAPDVINRLLSPKVFANFKRYDKDGEHKLTGKVDFTKESLIVKGNNLLALHSLKERFAGRVKLIYIDPPYNTGTDEFDYNDSFNQSTWCTFMQNRLQVAKELLSPEGTIAISIDQNEIGYLQILLDDTFKKENRKNIITIKRGSVTGAKVINPGVVNISEYLVLYSQDTNKWKPNRIFMSKERDERYNGFILNYEKGVKHWKFTTVLEAFAEEVGLTKTKLKKHFGDDYEAKLEEYVYTNAEKVIQAATLDENSVSQAAIDLKNKSLKSPDKVFVLKRKNAKPYHILNGKLILFAKHRMTNVDGKDTFSQPATDIWDDVLPNDIHNEGGVQLRKGKKPEKLLARLIELCTKKDELVLDFFAGSGTTGSVCLKMNRRFIICEQLEYTETLPLNRLQNTVNGEQSGVSKNYGWMGGGSFIYSELANDNSRFIDQIEDAKNTKALKAIWEAMQKEGFISYRVNEAKVFDDDAEGRFSELSLDEQKQILIRTLDLNQLYVNYSEIDDKRYSISKEEKKLNKQFYTI